MINETDKQVVLETFSGLESELNRVTDDFKAACADAALEGDFDKLERSKVAAMGLQSFVEEVLLLSRRWKQGDIQKPVPSQVSQNNSPVKPRKRATILKVRFINLNKEVECKTAVETFVECLRLFKFEHVAMLKNQRANGYPMVSKTEHHSDERRYEKSGVWFINYPSNTEYKKRALDEISQALKIPVKVDIV